MSHHYTDLSLPERIQIQTLLEAFFKVRAIARTLKKGHTPALAAKSAVTPTPPP